MGNSPGEEKMSKFKFITLAASIMLAITFTLSCSQDNISGPDGSLNGTWERVPATIEINGTELIQKVNGVNEYKGTITYDGSNISYHADYYWDGVKWATIPTNPESVRGNYTLSSDGKTLTFSGFTGENEKANGDWTKKQ
jgi:hypothetical protein